MASTWMISTLPLCSTTTSCCQSCSSKPRGGYVRPRVHVAGHGSRSPGQQRSLSLRSARLWHWRRRLSPRRRKHLLLKLSLPRRSPSPHPCARHRSRPARHRALLNRSPQLPHPLPKSQTPSPNLLSHLLRSSPPRIRSLKSLVPQDLSLVQSLPHLRSPERITTSRLPRRRGFGMTQLQTYCFSEGTPRT